MSTTPAGATLRTLSVGGLAAALVLPATALAADDKKPIEWGGAIFAHYGYLLGEEAEGYNEFDLDRVYLSAKGKLASNLSIKVQTDVGRAKAQEVDIDGDGTGDAGVPEDEKLRLFIKNAYLQWGVTGDVQLRFGVAGTAFVGIYDKFWGQRYISKSFTDDNKILDSADIGVHALGNHADGLVSWQAAVINGEGYGSAETDSAKAAQARVTIDPLASGDNSLPITVFASQDFLSPDTDDAQDPVMVLAPAIGFQHEYVTIWGEYVMQSQGDIRGAGYSATLMPTIPKILNVIVRYDVWDPDADAEEDGHSRLIGGVAHDFLEKVSAALTYETTTREAEPDLPEKGVFLRMQAGF